MLKRLFGWVKPSPDAAPPPVPVVLPLPGPSAVVEVALAVEEVAAPPPTERALFDQAVAAQQRHAWGEAASHWAELRALNPQAAHAYARGVNALRMDQRVEEAAALAETGLSRFPANREVLVAAARLAQVRGNYDAALGYWAQLSALLPADIDVIVNRSLVMRAARRFEEAEELLRAASARFPNHPDLACGLADIAGRRADWAEAFSRWRQAVQAHPDHPPAHIGQATLLMTRGNVPAAERLSQVARARFPADRGVAVLHAKAAAMAKDWPEAAARWRVVSEIDPGNAEAELGLLHVLIHQGAYDEAEVRLATLRARPGDRAALDVAEADIATRRGDLQLALRLWGEGLARFPGNRQMASGLLGVQLRLAETGESAQGEVAPTGAALSPRAGLLARFESLGDDCEFGIVQRDAGLEPLGLLRWTSAPLPALIEALSCDFAGMGEAAQTRLSSPLGEYMLHDDRFGMQMHTFIKSSEQNADALLPKLCRRMVFLRRKMLEDLAEAGKIFVYKSKIDHGDAAFRALQAALGRHGGNRLLVVTVPGPQRPAGAVRLLGAGCAVGSIARFNVQAPALEDWHAVCAAAVEMLP